MENYFYINVSISFVVLALIKYGKGTCTANYYLSSLAIIAWFIPYPLLAELIPKEALRDPIIIAFSSISVTGTFSGESMQHFDIDLWLKWSLGALMSIGVLIFMQRFIKSTKWRHKIMNDPTMTLLNEPSAEHKLSIYSVNSVSSGLLLGIINPVIIVSTKITNLKHIELIICHEKQHLRSLDNVRLLILELAECLFWWNPLVRYLININRFFIEARCDENASNDYGKNAYIEDLDSLILAKHYDKLSNFVCSASSTLMNNIGRIKLLKEKRKMTFRKRLTYTLIILSTIITMSWNTFATATNNKVDQKRLGALVSFDATITNKVEENKEDIRRYQVTYWADFGEKVKFKLGEFGLNIDESDETPTFNMEEEVITIYITAKDLGESAYLEYELIESTQSNEKIVSKPEFPVNFGQEGIIEIDNPQTSKYAYSIRTTLTKEPNPT